MRLSLVILAVSDVRRATDFYLRALGWEQVVDVPVYAELKAADGLRLGLYERTSYALNTGGLAPAAGPGQPTATELYFLTADVDAAITRLEFAGATTLSALSALSARAWGDEAAYFTDPDGNVVVVARPL